MMEAETEEDKMKKVSKIQKEIEKLLGQLEDLSPQHAMVLLTKLSMIGITWDILVKSGLGHAVNDLRRASTNPDIQKKAKLLLKRWRTLQPQGEWRVVTQENEPEASGGTSDKPESRKKKKVSTDRDSGTESVRLGAQEQIGEDNAIEGQCWNVQIVDGVKLKLSKRLLEEKRQDERKSGSKRSVSVLTSSSSISIETASAATASTSKKARSRKRQKSSV